MNVINMLDTILAQSPLPNSLITWGNFAMGLLTAFGGLASTLWLKGKIAGKRETTIDDVSKEIQELRAKGDEQSKTLIEMTRRVGFLQPTDSCHTCRRELEAQILGVKDRVENRMVANEKDVLELRADVKNILGSLGEMKEMMRQLSRDVSGIVIHHHGKNEDDDTRFEGSGK